MLKNSSKNWKQLICQILPKEQWKATKSAYKVYQKFPTKKNRKKLQYGCEQ